MLSQFEKYHDLPSIEMLKAYKLGTLSLQDRMWVEYSLNNNSMVKAVAAEVGGIDVAAVAEIAKRTHKFIDAQYLSQLGFWTKYGMWIGFGVLALLLGVFTLFNNRIIPKYSMDNLMIQYQSVSSNNQNSNIKSVVVAPISTLQNSEEEMSARNIVIATKKISEAKKEDVIGQVFTEISSKPDWVVNRTKYDHKKIKIIPALDTSFLSINTVKRQDKTKKHPLKNEINENRQIVLVVKKVQLLSKRFADYERDKQQRQGNAPMRSSQRQKSDQSAKAFQNLPHFQGGEGALKNYFKGRLHPVKIGLENSEQYDRAIRLDIVIKANGKLDGYKIFGHLNPKHQKELEQAIKDLPRFVKGSEKVVYSLGISF